ncbi:glycosyltransferase family 2 protein [Microbacterium dauci]|uniref:Glycosyltransferase family 2 protein n=1 Tax=Microbacterium dauci TaxID=3048008 RepID=A0ABT6ZEE9_9MICO|nr:glycosyltransferase family 2 protein [Microbacterium sp. LX3-4]MDJ1114537.1 glycosyltransferase family 2 protein [Microbacterium sp. LX3-4]
MHDRPSAAVIVRARAAFVACILLWVAYMTATAVTLSRGGALRDVWHLSGTIVFLVSVALLTFSACMYLLARAGALPRFAAHRRARRIEIDDALASQPTRVLALLPSYDEDPELVRLAMWSTALQCVPDLRVVLLLDDPPEATATDPRAERLCRTRALAAELTTAFAPVADAARAARQDLVDGSVASDARAQRVADVHAYAAMWLRRTATEEPVGTHVERFFVERVLLALADDFAASAAALLDAGTLELDRAVQLTDRVAWTFGVEASVFERKRYPALSHEPNKAMNLNAYLALLGTCVELERTDGGIDTITVRECDAIITLDADSMLLPEYAARLHHDLVQPGNERIAIIQTPYSAYRDAPSHLERLAGATTDLQHIVHQGLTAFGATFWVGANAMIRRAVLEDLRSVELEDGRAVTRFIRGRTVIEDTEASIDVAAHGWTLKNFPERLSYSTTPPDFGALVIQRRRWANGGLLVLPRLRALAAARRTTQAPMPMTEFLLRANYLGSITWVTLGLLVLLTLVPLDGELVSAVLLLIALPYFIEMASDLRRLGYRRRDVVGVYGLNLLLISVNLAGTFASVAQAFSGRKATFARTPKVHARTPAGVLYVLAPVVIAIGATSVAVRSAADGAWVALGFAAATALCVTWAGIRLIGLRAALADLWHGWLEWVWVDAPVRSSHPDTVSVAAGWRAVLDDGPIELVAAQ